MKTCLGFLQVALIFAVVIAFVRLAVGAGAARATWNVWRELPRRPTFQFAVGIWLAVFLIDLWQTEYELLPHPQRPEDFTAIFHQIEGALPATIQSIFEFWPLTFILSFAYLIVFPGLLFANAHAFDRLDDGYRVRLTAYVYLLNYLLCLPFYLFFPVHEPWEHGPAGVRPLMDHIHPWLIDIVRPMSGIDNCFPSYHVSLTVSLVLIARGSGLPRYARAATISGVFIIFSTVYLGFHWLTDLVGGLVAGTFVFWVSRPLAEFEVWELLPVESGRS